MAPGFGIHKRHGYKIAATLRRLPIASFAFRIPLNFGIKSDALFQIGLPIFNTWLYGHGVGKKDFILTAFKFFSIFEVGCKKNAPWEVVSDRAVKNGTQRTIRTHHWEGFFIMKKRTLNFLKGVGSVMNIAPAQDYRRFILESSPAERIAGHWERAGRHIYNAIDQCSDKNEEKT